MRLFVTGASGWIGSAATAELLAAGHDVVGLARSDAAAQRITEIGAEVHRGNIDDVAALAAAAAASDGVVHLAYNHDLSEEGRAAETDRAAIGAFGAALAGTGRPLIIATGLLGVAPGRTATEADRPDPTVHARVANSSDALELAGQGVRSTVIRFAPSVHDVGDVALVPHLIQIARERGASGYIGDGGNRWPSVHRRDAGKLVALAVAGAPAGSVLHGVAESGVATREIAEAIGRGLDLPVRSVAVDEAEEHFGPLASFFAADLLASSDVTRQLVGWQPQRQGLIADLDLGHYFSASAEK